MASQAASVEETATEVAMAHEANLEETAAQKGTYCKLLSH